jgi:Fe-S-cluster-containing hydrogenase component 2
MKPPRDPFAIPLRCMHCKTSGAALVQEHHPDDKTSKPRISVSSVSTGFRVAREGSTALMTEFRCDHCDEVAG